MHQVPDLDPRNDSSSIAAGPRGMHRTLLVRTLALAVAPVLVFGAATLAVLAMLSNRTDHRVRGTEVAETATRVTEELDRSAATIHTALMRQVDERVVDVEMGGIADPAAGRRGGRPGRLESPQRRDRGVAALLVAAVPRLVSPEPAAGRAG